MRPNVTLRLILKDLRMNRTLTVFPLVGGLAALSVMLNGGQTSLVLGGGFFFIAMILCASMVPMSNIVNERKRQTLAFMMSLPVSAAQYGTAKLVSSLGMFLVPWLTLVGAALYLIRDRHVLPAGTIPTALILANLPCVGFCLITGTVLVAESEVWGIAVLVVLNSSYWIVWYLLASRAPSVTQTWTSPVVVWNAVAVDILAAEFAVIMGVLALSLVLQSRKRNFI